MKTQKMLIISSMVILALVMTACGGGGGGASSGGGSVNLSQSVEASSPELGGGVKVSYPEGWVANTELVPGGVALASKASIFESGAADLSALGLSNEDSAMILFAFPAEIASAFGAAGGAPKDIIGTLASTMGQSIGGEMTLGEPADVTIGSATGAKVTGSSAQGDIVIYLVENNGGLILGVGVTASGQAANREATFLAIMGTAQFVSGS